MSAQPRSLASTRRTTAVDVFERMRADIVSLRLPPGTKLSEAEVARTFDVSRQPVREAFIRLSNLNLVRIQPQRATVVRRISRSAILESRFLRTAVEIEIVRRACMSYDAAHAAAVESNLAQQLNAVRTMDSDLFNALDYEFHRLVCVIAECEFAFKTIAENKVYVDRLCMLALASKAGQQAIYDDHVTIFDRLRAGDEDGAVTVMRLHLSRLNQTLDHAQRNNPAYFED